MDVLTPEQRRRCMSAIRSKHTKPELAVRFLLRRLGQHYKLHAKNLPGKPDLVIPLTRKAIFVHACFWHMHRCHYGKVVPATNVAFWRKKRRSNVNRDRQKRRALRKQGWKVYTVWECWTRKPAILLERIAAILNADLPETADE